MRRFVVWCFTRKRSLRASILTLFLSLFTLAFSCILIFTYSKNYHSILYLSSMIAKETMNTIQGHFEKISSSSERNSQIIANYLSQIPPVTVYNPTIQQLLLQMTKYNPHFSSIGIGTPDGSLVNAVNISLTSTTGNYFLNTARPLPEDAAFALQVFTKPNGQENDRWIYYNNNFQEVASEQGLDTTYNVFERPWYQGTVDRTTPFWTGFYTFAQWGEKGITLGVSSRTADGKLLGVVSADLSLHLITEFLNQQKVGISGKAFLLNVDGVNLIPEDYAKIPKELISKAYSLFLLEPSKSDHLFDFEDHSYLTFKSDLSHLFGTDWMILVISPLNDFLGPLITTQHQIFAFIFLILLISITAIIIFSRRISSPITTLVNEIKKIKDLELTSHVRVRSNIREIYQLDQAIAAMRYVVQSFSKYVPNELVKKLFDMEKEISLGGEKKEITIFFSDVENFTSITESEPIDVLLPLLAEYFDAMTTVILKQEGTIDKFLGDGIMAFWGAPVDTPNHAQKACDTALLCHAMLIKFNEKRRLQNKPVFPTRFGIHSGEVIVGNIGTEERMNYTAIGDAVNTTARLQAVDKLYHTSIIISDHVQKRLSPSYVTRPLDIVSVKGKTQKIKIHELVGKIGYETEIEPTQRMILLCKQFAHAHSLMEQGNIKQAKEAFQTLAQKFPEDYPTKLYLERLHDV